MTARDAAATFNLIEIGHAILQRPNLELVIHAQRPALDYFRKAGLPVEPVELPSTAAREGPEARDLRAHARQLLERHRPNAVVCGLSTPFDGGIDEALLAETDVPSFVMQDFWGEANAHFGRYADCYLGLDEEAVRLTRERHGADGVAIGSPRHAVYGDLDLEGIRARTRTALDVSENTLVYGLFGQALHRIEGYRRTLRSWGRALSSLPAPRLAIYRKHPRESEADARATLDILAEAGLECVQTHDEPIEETLLACDVASSAFSLCNYDAAYLNYFAPRPLVTPISLMFDAEIVDYCRKNIRLDEFPFLRRRLALAIRSPEKLASTLAAAGEPETREAVWKAAKTMADPRGAADRALAAIESRMEAGPRPT